VLIYAAIGAFGLLFLLLMLFVGEVFGGDHDMDHAVDHDSDLGGGPSFLSARIIAAFMTAFGVGGVVARYYDLAHPLASGIGVASGFVMAGLVYQFARILYGQQASSELRMVGLIGQTGEVSIGIPEHGVGQVTVTAAGERTTHIARSADGGAIAPGAAVVIAALGGDSVIVERAPVPAKGASA